VYLSFDQCLIQFLECSFFRNRLRNAADHRWPADHSLRNNVLGIFFSRLQLRMQQLYLFAISHMWNVSSSAEYLKLVSIVSDYIPDDRGSIRYRGKGFFSSLCVQTSSEAHPSLLSNGYGGPFPGVKRGQDVTLTSHTYLVPR
jgi:hypothetical protein